MNKIFLFLFLSLFTVGLYGYEVTLPQNTTTEIDPEDEEIKSLVWNRFVNKNFVILSIDEKQGLWLNKNIDSINHWCTNRWGLPGVEFSKECRIFCVPNKSLLKKLFGIDDSRVEVRKKDGEIEIIAMWLVLEETSPSLVTPYLTRASFAEFGEQKGKYMPWWFARSAEILSSPNLSIRNTLNGIINVDKSNLNCSSVFNLTFEDYQKLSKEEKDLFDQKCLVLCLMLRKELGEVKLHSLLRLENKENIEKTLNIVYGYKDIKEFDAKFLLFWEDLTKAVSAKKIPDSYIQINNRSKL